MTTYTLPDTRWKTVREVQLEEKVAKLERALHRAHYDSPSRFREYDLEMTAAPTTVCLPRMASIDTIRDGRHLGVAARVWTEKPFGVSYFVDAGLLTDPATAAQVLGLQHEHFILQLADFVKRETAQPSPTQKGKQ